MNREKKYRIGLLGATGTVGQRALSLLDGHPWFEVTAVAASEKSAGQPYGEAVSWHLDSPMPGWLRDMPVQPAKPGLDCDLVLSAMDNAVAGEIEEAFAAAGYPVISNAKNHRMEPDVPLVIPEVNPGHLDALEVQKGNRGWGQGFILTNPNCSTIGLVTALKPIDSAFGLKRISVTTLQALSGAGFPGVPSLSILDNVIPLISGEEAKMESESLKLLGSWDGQGFSPADIAVSAQCNRVHVRDGHLECVSVELAEKPSRDELVAAWQEFQPEIASLNLPSAPNPMVIHRQEPDRPQPRLDRNAGRGMAVSVGRVRECPLLHYKFIVLSHNTVRGAAGAAIINAELVAARGLLDG